MYKFESIVNHLLTEQKNFHRILTECTFYCIIKAVVYLTTIKAVTKRIAYAALQRADGRCKSVRAFSVSMASEPKIRAA